MTAPPPVNTTVAAPPPPPAPKAAAPKPAPAAAPQVTNTEARMLVTMGLDILPGQTVTVPEAYRDPSKDNYYKKLVIFKAGWLKDGAIQMPREHVSNMTEPKALLMIKAEKDLSVLTEWLDGETREAVVEAIEKRARELS